MSTSVPEQVGRLSEADYVALEATSAFKHEYLDGEVYLLAGAREDHNRLAANILGLLWQAARPTHCRVLGSDMRLRISTPLADGGERVVHYYPDVQVVCDPTDADPLAKSRPCLVVEVSSPSTAAIDAREKLLAYRGLESLRGYLIVSQDHRHVVHHYRDPEGAWWKAERSGVGDVRLNCPEVVLALDDIYEGVTAPDAQP